ncbi:hypothetical protein ACLOJK_029437 [Asimina triloba]
MSPNEPSYVSHTVSSIEKKTPAECISGPSSLSTYQMIAATPSYTQEEGNAVSSGSLIFLKIVFKADMSKIQERVFCVPSVSSYGDIRLGEETMGVMEQEQLFKKRDDTCVLDVERLVF